MKVGLVQFRDEQLSDGMQCGACVRVARVRVCVRARACVCVCVHARGTDGLSLSLSRTAGVPASAKEVAFIIPTDAKKVSVSARRCVV